MKVKIGFKKLSVELWPFFFAISESGYLIRIDCFAYSWTSGDCWSLEFSNGDFITYNPNDIIFNSKKLGVKALKKYITHIIIYDEAINDESQINYVYKRIDDNE